MLLTRFVVGISSVIALVLGTGMVSGQTYPQKPVRIITGAAGGGNDATSRLIAQALTDSWGQQVIVDNRGGSGIIPARIVAEAPPDGYTLLLYGSAIWLLPFLRDNVPYDPVRDFSPVTLAAISPQNLVVHPSLPVKSVKELIALAKTKPGVLNFGSSGTGSATHLTGELFKAMAGVNIVHVPYKGTALVFTDLISGQVQLSFPSVASARPHVESGRLRALAVTTAQPAALAPGLPTVAASGLPGFEAGAFFAIFAPAKTPAMLINRLNQEIVRVHNRADVKERFFKRAIEVVGSSPEQLAATVKSDMARMGKVIKDAGIRAE